MNKQVMAVSLLAALLIPATNGFAQFKISSKSAKNLANLDRVVARATKKPSLLDRALGYKNPGPTKLPSGVVVPGNAGLLAVKMPKTITSVNESFLRFVDAKYKYKDPDWQPGYVYEEWIKKSTHNQFYTSQKQLAQDLDAFYHGIADIFIGPDGRKVKLYALPADGILYKPEGYTTPLVLNANDYFVIYDVVAKTGKIAENKPEVYNLFKHSSEDEIYGEFMIYDFLAPGGWRPKDPRKFYMWNRDLARNDKLRIKDWEEGGYPEQFVSEKELGKALYQFYRTDAPEVYWYSVGMTFYVYELPKPVVIVQPGTEPMKLNPDDYVVVYPRGLYGGRIIKRQVIEDPELFKFVLY